MQESLKVVSSAPSSTSSDLLSSPDTTTATFADDTAVLAIDTNAVAASQKLQPASTPSTPITFKNRRETCPAVYINELLPQAEDVKYLGLHLDRHLTSHKHIFTKRKHLGTILTKLYWLLGHKSKFDLNNKLLIYNVAIKSIWTLWGTASTSNIEIMERFQSKVLHLITDAPWYVTNVVIQNDLQIPTIIEEITRLSSKYSTGLNTHPNHLVTQLSNPPTFQRLRKLLPSHLPYRFTQNT
jgi:hypothetical protein